MPITYRIDRQRGRIVTTCSGSVTLRDVMAHFDALEKDPERPARLDVLLDLTDQESIPVTPQMQAAADRVGLVTDLVFGNCAVVATGESLFGMARMFEVLARGHFAAIRTFRSMREAVEWLDAA
ncbi:MAG TPA: STAS/SEC14 domain-containing protein [Thermoanaerobaculia bacterium]|nr:STAS/SEC14 domain-containing protein [Thermoanaerobaculia bacterium]